MESDIEKSVDEVDEPKPILPSDNAPKTVEREEGTQPGPVFKVPMVIGPRPQKLKQLKQASTREATLPENTASAGRLPDVVATADSRPEASKPPPVTLELQKNTANNSSKSPAETLQDIAVAIPYKEPAWGGMPSASYSFEVLKGGIIVESIDLSSRAFTLFGRLASCDVKLEHPSISRYHAVVQYRATAAEDHPAAFYLYDLDSTHGTLLNKCRLKPRCYYRLHVGHMLKLGGSSRMFILQGPEGDAEEESALTVTEIKDKARQDEETQRQEEERLQRLKEEADAKREKEDEDQGIDWGMGDDAAEEDGYGDNPYALDTPLLNEELYVSDPKKTLRGWFEREGYDLEYDVEEKGQAHFLCRVQLPLDTPSGSSMYAEASVKGKKKEAVVACALEACRLLDRHGVLRQANHEGRHRKSKNWQDEDFYDSDEDTYLDQTGTIEKKRLQRIQRAGKEGSGVETYESLTQKHKQILLEIEKTEEILTRSAKQEYKEGAGDLDSLDEYMMAIKSSKDSLDKKAKTGLKIQLSQLKQEEQKLRKLVNITKPASLPIFSRSEMCSPTSTQPPVFSPKETTMTVSPIAPDPKILTEGEESAEKPTKGCSPLDKTTNKNEEPVNAHEDAPSSAVQEKPVENDGNGHAIITCDVPSQQPVASKRRSAHDSKRNKRSKQKLKYDYDSTDPNYAMWLPPEGQSGDGRTDLNEKFGY